mgnify:CR=1 FL=1
MQKRCITLILSLTLVGVLCAQGPINGFMPKPGQVDLAFTYSQETFDEFFDQNGDKVNRNIDATSYNIFLEYGADERTSIVFTAPYINNDEDNRGWQDASIWLKYRNDRTERENGYHNFITAIGLSFPMSRYANDNLRAIGRRATTFQGRFGWQYDAKYGWFVQVQSGVDFQMAPEAQAAVPILVRAGMGTRFYYFDLWLEQYQGLQSSNNGNNLASGAGSTWTRAGGTFYVPVQRWLGVFAGGALVLGGKNIGQSTRWNVGVVFRAGQ